MPSSNSYELETPDKNLTEDNKENGNIAKQTFEEWCDASTIHGMRYIGSGSKAEKIYWILIILISSTFCIIQISTAYQKWQDNPLIIAFDEKLVPTNDIPFPAITICNNLLKIGNDSFDYYNTYFEMVENGTESVNQKLLDIFELVSEQCLRPLWSGYKKIELTKFFENSTLDTERVHELFKALSRKKLLNECSGLISDSWWNCRKGFTPILTPNGMCWTFNMLNKEELINDNVRYFYGENQNKLSNWDADTGYKSEDNVYPYRSKNVKKRLGLAVELKHLRDLSHDCWWKDVNIYVHHPAEVPYETKPWDLVFGLRKISITPEIMLASKELQSSHTPESRKCFFQGERQLAFFKTYSQANCQVECLANKTVEMCGCVNYWMPGFKSTPICGIKNYDCYTKVKYRFSSNEGECNCQRLCNTITYHSERETLSTDYQQMNRARDMINSLQDDDKPDNTEDTNSDDFDQEESLNDVYIYSPVFLWIQFSKPEYLAMRMSAQFSLTDFISQCGGLLGLFMGVSILSVIELLYYFTVKLMHRSREQKTTKLSNE